jgi:hypothetical protein
MKSHTSPLSRRLVTSCHEAAHGVARVVLDLPFEKIEVYDAPKKIEVYGDHNQNAADGYMTVLPNSWLRSPGQKHAAIVSTLASIPTELWLDPEYGCRPRKREPRSNIGFVKWLDLTETVCKDDWDDAQQMAGQFGVSMREALEEAYALVYGNWDAIVRVAEALDAAGVLSCDEVRDLCYPGAHTVREDGDYPSHPSNSTRTFIGAAMAGER